MNALCIVWGCLVCTCIASSSFGAIITVSTTGLIHTINQGIETANPNDTLYILAGQYHESQLIISKPLYLQGIDWPQIIGDDSGDVILITAANVTITGFEISNAPVSFLHENAGVMIDHSSHTAIFNNRFTQNFFGVYLAKSDSCNITGNTITGAAVSLSEAGNGIHLWYCRDANIAKNNIQRHRDGIYFEFVKQSKIADNVSNNNFRYGLHFMFSDSCDYERNQFEQDGAGVAVMYTGHIEMRENIFAHNWGGSSYGLLLKDIKDSKIERNKFLSNSVGLHIEGSDRNSFAHNEFADNGWAVKIMANAVDNQFRFNNFQNNSFQVSTNSRQSNSIFEENYWDTYNGYDLDCNGYGDSPYHPVSLYSLIVENNPPTLLLVRSLLVDVLNLAERLIPTLTPETLVDAKPLLKPAL